MNTGTATAAKPETQKARKARIIAAGRAELAAWLTEAKAHGTIYYNVEHVARSGMSRRIALSTIYEKGGFYHTSDAPKPELVRCWPRLGDAYEHHSDLDIVARDWGFSFRYRAFVIGGCEMDMVFALVDDLAGKAFGNAEACKYANAVRREAF